MTSQITRTQGASSRDRGRARGAPPAGPGAGTTTDEVPRPSWWQRTQEARVGYSFLLPMLALFIVFRFGPMLASSFLSVTDYRLSGQWTFVGADNFSRLIADTTFRTSLRVTLVYVLIAVPLSIGLALGTALLLERITVARGFFRSIFFLPYVTSFVLAAVVWKWIFEVETGLINGLLARMEMSGIPFLQSTALVLPSIATVSAWKGFGYSMLILLAGLQAIPQDIREAALMDGASAFQRFRLITMPLLKPVLFFVLVIETISAFQVFDVVYVMTGGGPGRASYSLVYMLYDQGFRFFNFGYASAIGLVLFAIVLLLSLVQRLFFEKGES